MTRKALPLLVAAILTATFFAPSMAFAADLCRAVALRDLGAMANSSYVIAKGEYQDAVTQFRRNAVLGTKEFCSHGGSCYPVAVNIGGKEVEALRLVNCVVGSVVDHDGDITIYAVEVDRDASTTLAEVYWDD